MALCIMRGRSQDDLKFVMHKSLLGVFKNCACEASHGSPHIIDRVGHRISCSILRAIQVVRGCMKKTSCSLLLPGFLSRFDKDGLSLCDIMVLAGVAANPFHSIAGMQMSHSYSTHGGWLSLAGFHIQPG